MDVVDSDFKQCNIGIAVTDGSRVRLINDLFDSNIVSYDTNLEKWRWQIGGHGEIRNTIFRNSVTADIRGDKFSSIILSDQYVKKLNIIGKLKLSNTAQ